MVARVVYAVERSLLPDDIKMFWVGDKVQQWRNLVGFCLVETVSCQKLFNPHYLSQECFALSGWFELYNVGGRIYLIDDEG